MRSSEGRVGWEGVALGAIVLLALGLRLFELTGQSLWYDEGVSVYMTPRSFAEIASATAVDIHPPLYYWLLMLWSVPFGQGEAGLRAFSVLLGTLMVWATWGVGRLVGGRAAGMATGLLLAVSPLAVQYSQEVRMYALAGLLAAASSWAGLVLLRALQDDAVGRRRLAALSVVYGLLVAALLYTHYYGTLVVAAQQLYAALTLGLTRRWRIVPFWALGSGLAALLFLPWLPVALRQTGYYPGLGSPRPSWALVLDAVNVLSIGIATTRFSFRAGLAPFLGLAGLGLAWLALTPNLSPAHRERGGRLGSRIASPSPATGTSVQPMFAPRSGGGRGVRVFPALADEVIFILLWLVVPIAGIVVLSHSRPLYEPRFLMLVLPAWAILVGAGLAALGRLTRIALGGPVPLPPVARQVATVAVGMLVTVLLLIPTARSLASYYFDPSYARDDYRGLAQTVSLREQPGDAIVLTAPGQIEIFEYYFHGGADLFPLPRQRPIDPADTRARLEAIGDRHDRVWLVRWAAVEADPDDLILGWLEGRGRRLGSQQFGRVELRLYDLRATARTLPFPLPPLPRQGEGRRRSRCSRRAAARG